MTITGSLILIGWLFLIPLAVGIIPALFVDKRQQNIGFMWTTGHILLWAVFQVLCVGLILTEGVTWEGFFQTHFPYVVTGFGVVSGLLAVAGIVFGGMYCKRHRIKFLSFRGRPKRSKREYLCWGIFFLLLAVQLICSITMRYADGDDAFYVAVSTITESSNTMYKIQPYSAGSTSLSTRHSLAPFPIWIAFLARISGVHTAVVAHTVVATTLIFMTYVIYGQIGKLLFADGSKKKEQLPIFLSFAALLVIFGDYSIYTPENFMIARSRQGKAALGNIIVPMVVFLFLLLFERIKQQRKSEWMLWIILAATVTAACLCSTLGTFLMCLLLGVTGLCAGCVYRRWELIWKTALCCVPALVYAALYFVLG
ncbi:MAG: hypothetical protein IJX63_09400 [Lachnospiraceae bacterium]|nr:hypothetical protein [Lachnospiraceae bacterium]